MNTKDLTYHVNSNTTLNIGNRYIIKQRNKEINNWINNSTPLMILEITIPIISGIGILYLAIKHANPITLIISIPMIILIATLMVKKIISNEDKKLEKIHEKYDPHITEVTIPATLNKDVINSVNNEKREILANKFLEFKENPSNQLADDIAHTIDLLASV